MILNLRGWDKEPTLIGSIHVAARGEEALRGAGGNGAGGDSGHLLRHRERPPAAGVLRDAQGEHPELKLTIEGHTDNVGSAESNLALSEKRAAAVRQFLVDTYQIDGARLSAKGLGQSKPAGANDTPEGRQANRRVELVKM
ncbi:MAG TPA: OmpA family protein [Gemmatimonadales bacterium]|nr:OmpA family protein [Gemmatimonadales bacterium]